MTNKRLHRAFRSWVGKRPGGLRGFIATVLLTAAALMILSRTLGRHARSHNRSRMVGAGARSKNAEARRQLELSRKLDAILARIAQDSRPIDTAAD